MVKYFEEIWIPKALNLEKQQMFWDQRSSHFNEIAYKTKENQQRREKIIDQLRQKDFFRKTSHVLDIGCGPGIYSIAFAKECESVTALDLSSEMLTYGEQNAKKEQLKNIEFIQEAWENIDIHALGWEGKFDLVFASMCPGINSADALKKMVEASGDACFLSHFVERKNVIKEELMQQLDLPSKRSYENSIYLAFNLLWNMGYYPQIEYIDTMWEDVFTLEEMEKEYMQYFSLIKPCTIKEQKQVHQQVHQFLLEHQEDGKIKEQTQAKIGLLYWRKEN